MQAIRRQTTFWEIANDSEVLRIHFLKKVEQCFASSEFPCFEIVASHLVLRYYQYPWTSVFIGSSPLRPRSVYEELTALLAQDASPWRDAATYFNNQTGDPQTILNQGYGLLIDAPTPLAELASDVLTNWKVKWSSLPSRPSRGPLKAFVAGLNFVVAEDFRVERIK